MSNELKKITCIECPKGCCLTVETDNQGCVIGVSGNECEKGDAYVRLEMEHPMRILTSSVLTEGLALKMIPVRTSESIPRDRIMEAMEAIKNICVKNNVVAGESVADNFLGLNVDLIATRDSIRSC